MYTQKEIQEICYQHNVEYHHHNQFEEPHNGIDEDLQDAIITVYSSQYGSWQLAITTTGEIIRPFHTLRLKLAELQHQCEKLLQRHKLTYEQ